ncbi:hypothetical protein NAPIS_ORF01887 [Vairimorpha apis BRL 01]|uniref:Uncharacterized protein n=1 Tax=Vairimorpha apis BRL 01 TaxID=1037528 RepID=T0L7S8_9MICR|nr:hypothetical protein NAPIS_ORF01887 [Vairimorpha apis BRL 01]
MDFNLEITKILAKIMQNNMKKKEMQEILYRIIDKMDYILSENDSFENFLELKREYEVLMKDIKHYHIYYRKLVKNCPIRNVTGA